MLIAHDLFATLGVVCLITACGYQLVALLAVLVWRLRAPKRAGEPATNPAVTLLKPLCGAERGHVVCDALIGKAQGFENIDAVGVS